MQLNLRDLFWLILVVGLGTALWLSRAAEGRLRTQLRQRDAANAELKSLLERARVIEYKSGPTTQIDKR